MGFFSFFEDAWNGVKSAGQALIGIFDNGIDKASAGSADVGQGMWSGDTEQMAKGGKEILEAAASIPGTGSAVGSALGLAEVTEGVIKGDNDEVAKGLGDIATANSDLAKLSQAGYNSLKEQDKE